jgi:hypothetical protein
MSHVVCIDWLVHPFHPSSGMVCNFPPTNNAMKLHIGDGNLVLFQGSETREDVRIPPGELGSEIQKLFEADEGTVGKLPCSR